MSELELPRSDENLEPQQDDSGEAQRALEDATHEPREYIEQNTDYRQAEAIQNTLTEVVENLGTGDEGEATGANLAYEEFPPGTQVANDHPGPGGDQPELSPDDVKGTGEQSDSNVAWEEHPPGSRVAKDHSGKGGDIAYEEFPPGAQVAKDQIKPGGTVAAEDDWEAPNLRSGPEEPLQRANFEKPILQEGMEKGLDEGMLKDPASIAPGPGGGIEGRPGERGPDGSLLDDVLGGRDLPGEGSLGFKGGPGDLQADPETQSGEPESIPGWGSPFLPGKGPGAVNEVAGGGSNKTKSPGKKTGSEGNKGGDKGSDDGKGGKGDSGKGATKNPTMVVRSNLGPKDAGAAFYDSQSGTWYYSTAQGVLQRSADLINMEVANILDKQDGGKSSVESTPVDGEGGADPKNPLGAKPDRDTPNPKYDPGQISLDTADGAGDDPAYGGVHPKYQKKVKKAIENMSRLRGARRVKGGSEVITDPPEHEPTPKPGPKSESPEDIE